MLIELTQGKQAMIDDEDYPLVADYRWFYKINKGAKTGYAYNPKVGYMHRVILGISKGSGVEVDHANMDGLNNRRSNIRACAPGQNRANTTVTKRNTSGFKGVSWDKRAKKWRAQIQSNGIKICIGLYDKIEEATKAYNKWALQLFREFARTNED